MSVVVEPSAREAFTPRELTDAYKDFESAGRDVWTPRPVLRPQLTGLARVLIVYEKSEAGVVILIRPTS
jgi:hypothetical protein